jgi:integrase
MSTRYEPVAGVRNLYKDHARKGSPFILKWKVDGKKKEKVLGVIGQKDAIRERDIFFVAPEEERRSPATIRCGLAYVEWITAGRKSRGQGLLGTATVMRYRSIWENHVEPVLGRVRVTDVTVKHIIDALDRVEAKGKDPYNTYVFLSAFFRAMTVEPYSYRSTNPVARLGQRKPPAPSSEAVPEDAVIEPHELEMIVAALPSRYKLDKGTRRALVRLAYHSGLRLSEILGLTWGAVDLVRGELHVEQQLRIDFKAHEPETWFAAVKGNKTKVGNVARIVPLSDEAWQLLREHREWVMSVGLYRGPESLLFPTKKHTPIRQSGISEGFTVGVEHAWREPRYEFTFHCLRHSYASRLFQAGASIEEVARLLGHSSDVTQKRYIHLRNREAYNEAYRERMRKLVSVG